MNKFVKLSLSHYKLGIKCFVRGCIHYVIGRFYDIVRNMEKADKHYGLAYEYGKLADFSLEMARSLIDLAD